MSLPGEKTISPLGRMSGCHSVLQQCCPLTIPKPLPKPSPLTLCPAHASYFQPGAVAQMTQRNSPSSKLDILDCTTWLPGWLVRASNCFPETKWRDTEYCIDFYNIDFPLVCNWMGRGVVFLERANEKPAKPQSVAMESVGDNVITVLHPSFYICTKITICNAWQCEFCLWWKPSAENVAGYGWLVFGLVISVVFWGRRFTCRVFVTHHNVAWVLPFTLLLSKLQVLISIKRPHDMWIISLSTDHLWFEGVFYESNFKECQ